jgi:glycosyltransferase involved in cell wall biosynthesis
VRAVSEWEKQEMIKKGLKPSLVRVISNGIEDEAYLDVDQEASEDIKEKVKNFGRYIIQIGRVYMIKNYETTIRALTNTPEDLKYVIAGPIGDNNYLKKLQKLVKDLNLEDRVIFLGVIRGVDKYYLIKHAQMMVHMALWESFCNVVHEGMSQGLICIVADNTALPLLIKDGVNGYCVETMDSKTVSEKIHYVLEHKNSSEMKAMIKVNREFGLEMSWRKVADKMYSLYNNLFQNI